MGEKVITLHPSGKRTKDTKRIQQTIEILEKEGGGTIRFASGIYYTGTVWLCSNLKLVLENGCTIIGSEDVADYTVKTYCHQSKKNYWQSLFFAEDCQEIIISGEGTVEGQGEKFPAGREAFSADDQAQSGETEYKVRPSLFYLKNCRTVRMSGIKLQGAAQFAVLAEDSSNLDFVSLTIHNRKNVNTDGIHLSVTEHVLIENCSLDCGDDAIVLNRKARNIEVRQCRISSRWAGIRIGPFSDGDFCGICVHDCEIYKTYGCAVKIQMGEGGCAQNIVFRNLKFKEVTGPVNISLQHFGGWEEKKYQNMCPGEIKDISFENIKADVTAVGSPLPHEVPVFEGEKFSCLSLSGLKDYKIGKITFSNCVFSYAGGYCDDAYIPCLPEKQDYIYPEYYKSGIMPCYALYARHVADLKIENVTFRLKHKDCRIPFILSDISKARADGLITEGPEEENG